GSCLDPLRAGAKSAWARSAGRATIRRASPWARATRTLESGDSSMTKSYNAADIEVLSGLEPLRRRPGMYSDTNRPNHLAHELNDNRAHQAIARTPTNAA